MQQATAAVLPFSSMDSEMLPVSCTATVAAHHPAHVASSYRGVSGIARQDEFTQPPHSVAGHYHPQTTAEPSYQPRGHSSTPAFGKISFCVMMFAFRKVETFQGPRIPRTLSLLNKRQRFCLKNLKNH